MIVLIYNNEINKQNENIKHKALQLFNKDYTRRSIAKELNISRNKLDNLLYDVPGIFELPSEEVQSNIVKEYKNNIAIEDIARNNKISTSKLKHILYMNGIEKRRKRTTSLNTSFFKIIDTENKAYWLGFMMADGYNDEKTGKIELALSEIDLVHLELFKETLNSGSKITEKIIQNKYKAFRLSLSSIEMSMDLASHGCIKNKSLKLEFPNTIPQELLHHFIRGYFDGDGCMYISSSNIFSCCFSILGTEGFLNKIVDNMNLHHNKKEKKGNVYSIRYGGRQQCLKIKDYLYKDATVYLKRKKEKFDLL